VSNQTRSSTNGRSNDRLRGIFVLNDIVDLIAEGEVSLLRAPREQRGDDLDWVHQQLKLSTLVTPSALLEECLNSFSAQYANTSNVDVSRAIKAKIVEDLFRLQSSPSIIENYRRFVVITATSIGDSDSHNNLVRLSELNLDDCSPAASEGGMG
jgi:hypothetical protein